MTPLNDNPEDVTWQRLFKAFFGVNKTTDEGLFTYRVMEEVRRLELVFEDRTWHRFMRWAVPALGLATASVFLALRAPVQSTPQLIETGLFQVPSSGGDILSGLVEE